ncbi:ribonucleoside diphosphate reductase beta subunit [Hokovirus HKV1]|uniref:ribonucleoside-diphosphate reductase n=1 Tax=Hokovirus HKV1 TaxID=1977638 RepID=A0A1V0SES1_9VIRU|nr:ribonucleoside diphosphate reductase beta subunit [Hokovirus HKV1]
MTKYEPLLDPKKRRFSTFPLDKDFDLIWKEYKYQVGLIWKAEDIDFSKDYESYMTLNENEQRFIILVLAFFANQDGVVTFNLSERFTREIQILEVLTTYQFQVFMENIHSETYSLMLHNIEKDDKKLKHYLNAITTIPTIKAMSDWTFKWIESDKSFAHRIVAFSIVEGIFFSGAFAAIFWLKKCKGNNVMPGLIQSNEYIARDEGRHCEFAFLLYRNHVNNKLTTKQINKIMREAVAISQNFMTDALPVRLLGMNQELMNDYIEYVADRHLQMLGYPKIYNKTNPFEFMNTIGISNKSNFFEHRPTDYTDANIASETKHEDTFGEDFSDSDDF